MSTENKKPAYLQLHPFTISGKTPSGTEYSGTFMALTEQDARDLAEEYYTLYPYAAKPSKKED